MSGTFSYVELTLKRACLAIGVVLGATACGSDPGSADLNELRALWLLDADRDKLHVRVAGRVIQSPVVSIVQGFNFATYNELFDPQPLNAGSGTIPLIFPNFYGVRLTGGDVLHVTAGGSRHQLYRREADFVYRSNYRLDENNTTAELSLSYTGNRFPTSMISARVFDVGNLMITDTGSVSEIVSLNWNIGDVVVPSGYEQLQHMLVTILSCTDINVIQESVVLDKAEKVRVLTVFN